MTKQQIRNAYNAGHAAWEILGMIIQAGVRFPDAVFRVSQALNMDAEEVEEMETKYDELC